MTPDEIADLLLSRYGRSDFPALLDELSARLTVEVASACKRRVDDAKYDNPRRALDLSEAALAIAARAGQPEMEALALWANGNALCHLCRYPEALSAYRRAESHYAARGEALKVAGLQINQVLALRDMGDYAAALSLAGRAREVCQSEIDRTGSADSRRYLGLLEMNAGSVHRQVGDMPAALAAYERGRALFEALQEHAQVARMDINRANALEEMARFDEAEALLWQSREALAAAGLAQEAARANLNLGVLAYRRGRHLPALRHLEAARAGFAAIPNPAEVAEVDLHRSFVYRELNLWPETVALAAEAGRVFARNAMAGEEQAAALLSQAAGWRRMGGAGTARAARLLAKARRILGRQGARNRVLLLDIERAAAALEAGQVATARRLAVRAARGLDPAVWPSAAARLDLLLARCARDGVPPDQAAARRSAERALDAAAARGLTDLQADARGLLADLDEARGDTGAARRHYSAALQFIEQSRADLALDEFQLGFMDDRLPVYQAAARLSRRAGPPAELFYLLNRQSAAPFSRAGPPSAAAAAGEDQAELRALRERWHWLHSAPADAPARESEARALEARALEARALEARIAELARRQQVRAADVAGAEPAGGEFDLGQAGAFLERVQAGLADDEILLAYYEMDGRLQAALATRRALRLVDDLAPADALRRALMAWRFQADKVLRGGEAGCAGAPPVLARLHEMLVGPLERELAGRERLRLVLPPEWHDAPFAGLHDGRRYLAERFELTRLSAPEGLLGRPGAGWLDEEPPQAMIVGYSDGGRLPHALAEAGQVQAALGGGWRATALLEEEATLERVRAASRECRLLHFATHAVFRPDNPLFSWIRLADARLTVAEVYEMALPRRPLVVLSACETGRGQPRGGGLLGMGRGFLAAGASGLVVSLWPAADEGTAGLMADFYARLPGPARALREAQRLAIGRGEHPARWAGFLHVAG